MLTWLVFGAVLVALVLGLSRPQSSAFGDFSFASSGDADLPCPWCRAQTNEDDRACPSCGQNFG
ncbi:MAG: hypothetical protein HKN07_14400 [Acidimicrobiia bacterium]|nr:hypothetical protein [Acidimicrobiia bacterium]